jgi:hypothetical protein
MGLDGPGLDDVVLDDAGDDKRRHRAAAGPCKRSAGLIQCCAGRHHIIDQQYRTLQKLCALRWWNLKGAGKITHALLAT